MRVRMLNKQMVDAKMQKRYFWQKQRKVIDKIIRQSQNPANEEDDLEGYDSSSDDEVVITDETD